jgi:outer membrane protein assembly factor BamA
MWIRFLVFSFALGAQQRFPILRIGSIGHSRLPEQAVVAASGLKLKELADASAFAKACERIVNSGFYRACNFQYQPLARGGLSGFDLKFTVQEMAETQEALLELPGVDAGAVWAAITKADPLIQKSIPTTNEASIRYIDAIEAELKRRGAARRITAKSEGDLDGGRTRLVFQPADLAKVRAATFSGNKAIDASRLQTAILRAAADTEFTERSFARLLDLNIRPMYEELGHLAVKFPSLRATEANGEASVGVAVEEGPVYKLGAVNLRGDADNEPSLLKAAGFQIGANANWTQVSASIEKLRKDFTSRGYLAAVLKQDRALNPDNTVALTIDISRGKLFYFGELILAGLDANRERAARRRWKLKPGDPMNGAYSNTFLKALLSEDEFRNLKGVSVSTTPAGEDRINVEIRFR